MLRILCLYVLLQLFAPVCQAQKDTTSIGALTEDDYAVLFSELDTFLDSLTRPKSFATISLTAGNRLLTVPKGRDLETQSALMFSPAAGYYHKSGLGIGGSAALVMNGGKPEPYQYLASLSYDYLKSHKFATGIAFTRFFTSDSLWFYTSPLQNEASAYFIYRNSWLKPSLTMSYGWGSQSSVEEYATFIELIRKKTKELNKEKKPGRGNGNGNNGNGNGNGGNGNNGNGNNGNNGNGNGNNGNGNGNNGNGNGNGNGNNGNGNGNGNGGNNGNNGNNGNGRNGGDEVIPVDIISRTETEEHYYDIAVSVSVRHDFYWMEAFSKKDHIRFTPQLTVNGGTQRFGLNQTTQSSWRINSAAFKPFASDQVALEEKSRFQPLSITAFLRTAYTRGKWYLQPQFIVDYYIPETGKHWTTNFMVSTGVIF
ncbi:hypothetical protein [Pseudocnuella soli]|uniref:hypothetical protein n=1 Tax=Pseudocnuella soli TaxID=2502779 RepID=UPI00195CC8BA|nr:hypothetical protein [Pseudocnuella soli]